jgi:hypothetical protein
MPATTGLSLHLVSFPSSASPPLRLRLRLSQFLQLLPLRSPQPRNRIPTLNRIPTRTLNDSRISRNRLSPPSSITPCATSNSNICESLRVCVQQLYNISIHSVSSPTINQVPADSKGGSTEMMITYRIQKPQLPLSPRQPIIIQQRNNPGK